MLIPTRIEPSVLPADLTPRRVDAEFRRLLASGVEMHVAGAARKNPKGLLSRGYAPRHRIDLFDTTFYVAKVRQNEDIRFFVAYILQPQRSTGRPRIHPRIFYKDISLVWRSASHFIRSDDENWIGKGDVNIIVRDGKELIESDEATTDLPLEMQTALESLIRGVKRIPYDDVAVSLVLRRGPDDRVEPYRDFTEPRRRAAADRRNLVNGGRRIARFRRNNDPGSLVFAEGFSPDFKRGVVETVQSKSRMYGGILKRFRIVSRNKKVQYLFFGGPHQAWIGSCQATTTELSSFGVRTIDVAADEHFLLPGFEYHSTDDEPGENGVVSQIPPGFAGAWSKVDPTRADASPWLERVPVIREFRRTLLRRSKERGRT